MRGSNFQDQNRNNHPSLPGQMQQRLLPKHLIPEPLQPAQTFQTGPSTTAPRFPSPSHSQTPLRQAHVSGATGNDKPLHNTSVAQKRREQPFVPSRSTNEIRVSGFWPRITKNALIQYFQSFGTVLDCRLVQDRRSGDANHAVVVFKDAALLDHLLSVPRMLNGTKLHLERTHTDSTAQEQVAGIGPKQRPWESKSANTNAHGLYVNTAPTFEQQMGGGGNTLPFPRGEMPFPRVGAVLHDNAAQLLDAVRARGAGVLMSELPSNLTRLAKYNLFWSSSKISMYNILYACAIGF